MAVADQFVRGFDLEPNAWRKPKGAELVLLMSDVNGRNISRSVWI